MGHEKNVIYSKLVNNPFNNCAYITCQLHLESKIFYKRILEAHTYVSDYKQTKCTDIINIFELKLVKN